MKREPIGRSGSITSAVTRSVTVVRKRGSNRLRVPRGRAAQADRFIERLGRIAEGEGLPRIAGRMIGVLILSGTSLGIDDLAAALKISRASVSTNSRLLQSMRVADLVAQPGSRRDFLRISGDPSSSLLGLGLQRMQSMRDAIRDMRFVLTAPGFDELRSRLRRMERFYAAAIVRLEAVLAEWRRKSLR